jgi:hypothetical protein
MMTEEERKGPKPSRQYKVIFSNPTQPMTKQPKRLHIYKPEDARGHKKGAFTRIILGYKNYFFGFEINHDMVSISLIFRHIVFSFKPV